MVSRDVGVPLFFDVYQGNESDPVEFDHFIRELIKRFNNIFTACDDLTIVCDKGNNSKKNLEMVDKIPFHFVDSLSPSHRKQILEVPLKPVPGLSERTSARRKILHYKGKRIRHRADCCLYL